MLLPASLRFLFVFALDTSVYVFRIFNSSVLVDSYSPCRRLLVAHLTDLL